MKRFHSTGSGFDDESLLRRVATGDESAFRSLYDTYNGRLFHYISRITKSEQVAEELVVDVFMKMWRGREIITRIDNFEAFLFRVAHNKSIDFLRSASRDARLKTLLWSRIESPALADEGLLLKEFEDRVRVAIDLLSPQRRKVYEMRRSLEYTHDQIAEKLNISRATVNNHIVEAQKFIRAYLSNEPTMNPLFLTICLFFLHAA